MTGGNEAEREMIPGLHPCRKCLLEEIPSQTELHRVIQERIGQMPEEERAPETVYRLRLSACKACPYLNQGTCGQCGCYVELRAARLNKNCPAVPSHWE